MKIIFDLDYTLLDTAKFKEALADAVTACGPDRERYEAAYAAIVTREGKVYDYDPDVHLEAVREFFASEEDMRRARAAIDQVLSRTEEFLYPGAKELLEALGTHEAKVSLMTLGNEKWQRAKVERSGLAEHFDEIVTTEKDKVETIRDEGEGEDRVIVVNDNGSEIAAMRKIAPEYSYVMKRGPKPVPSDLRVQTVDDIEELAAFLEKETGWELRREMREIRERDARREGTKESGKYERRPPESDSPESSRGYGANR